jgi:hypothetical protein
VIKLAEILNKQYSNSTIENLVSDILNLWDFPGGSTKDGNNGYLLKITDGSFLYIQAGTNYPRMTVYHKHKTVHQVADGTGDGYGALYAVKTNSATILCYTRSSNTNVSWNGNSVIVLANATNHRMGDISPVIALLKCESSIYYPYICADDTSDTAISMPTGYSTSSVTTNAKITVIEPFTADDTVASLNDVYICRKTQMPSLFTGDCAINGRRFYSFGWIFAKDD